MNDLELLHLIKNRFEQNMHRHPGFCWEDIAECLSAEVLVCLAKMEESGGEPDVVLLNNVLCFVDFSKQSPKGRRNCCYDEPARLARKKFPPQTSVEMLCREMRVSLLTEEEYRLIQEIEELDTTTSSWIVTPEIIRNLGGALFCDRRYGHTFMYHNGSYSYYSSRGFRAKLPIKRIENRCKCLG